jgi:hypothetical protein
MNFAGVRKDCKGGQRHREEDNRWTAVTGVEGMGWWLNDQRCISDFLVVDA